MLNNEGTKERSFIERAKQAHVVLRQLEEDSRILDEKPMPHNRHNPVNNPTRTNLALARVHLSAAIALEFHEVEQ